MNRILHNWGIRKRVLAIALAPAASIALLLTAYFIHSQVDALEQAATRRGEGLSQQLASAAAHASDRGDAQTLSRLAASLLNESDVLGVVLTDLAGQTLVDLSKQVTEADLTFRHPIRRDPVPVPASLAGAVPHDTIGWATVRLSGESIQRSKQRIVATSVAIALLGLTLAAFFARRLGRQVIEPVIQLTGAVREIGSGRFDTRVHTRGSGELKTLERGINHMSTALEDMQQQMQQRVDQATEDLLQTLEQLEAQNRMLDGAREQAREGERMKAEFLASISHEIRTPMNAITGFTNLLLKSPLDREQRDYACTVRDAANSLLTTINDIIDFSHIAAGDLELEPAPFNLRQVVDGALAIMAPAAYDKRLNVVVLFYTDVPEHLHGDGVRIRQVLMNLLSNAIRRSHHGRVVVRVMIEAQRDDEVELRISVQDSGLGLSPIERKRLSVAFAQADISAARRIGGTGIGLVVCKQLAESMGGTLGMESAAGLGSTFWFSFRARLQPESAPATEADPPFSGSAALLYEPDELQRSALSAQLTAWGMDVQELQLLTELDSKIEARDQADQPLLVFLGLRPEDMEETTVNELLSNTRNQPNLAVVVTMNTVNHRLLDEATVAGARVALPKVAPRDQLYAAIEQLLGRTDAPRPLIADAAAPTAVDLRGVKVLVVDDHEINRKLMRTLYTKAGADVEAAADGEQALQRLTTERYDLIFMDIQMPGLDGIETTERIRALEREAHRTPVIAVTAAVLPGERERLIRAGFDDCVVKPVHEHELGQIAARWLDIRAPERCDSTAYPMAPEPDWTEVAEPGPDEPDDPEREANRRAIRLAGGSRKLAEELLRMLLADLPDMQRRLNEAHQRGDFAELEAEVHKLHGAASYCAVDPLRVAAARLERALQQGETDVNAHMQQLNRAIDQAIDAQPPTDA